MNASQIEDAVTKVARANILGVTISALNMPLTLRVIERWVDRGERKYITVTPAHVIMNAQHDPPLRRIVNASGLTTPDGMSIVWLLKLQGFRDVERVYGPDLMQAACRYGLERGWRHFFYGGAEGVAAALASQLSAAHPGLQVAGTYTPPFRPLTEEEDRQIVHTINESAPDIVWIGLSSPKQERWMGEHLGRLQTPVMAGVGAAFDFLSGTKRQAPRWIQRSGFEWLFRFVSEPRRLWPRYRQYPKFAVLALAQLVGLRRYPLDG